MSSGSAQINQTAVEQMGDAAFQRGVAVAAQQLQAEALEPVD